MHKDGKDATNGLSILNDSIAVRGDGCEICNDCAGVCRSLDDHLAWLTQSIAESLPKEEENPTLVHWHGMLGVTTKSLRGR